MIEVTLELRLDSFVVNTVVETGELAAKVPHKALRFVCEKFTAARQLTETAQSADFSFLSSASQADNKAETDRESDAQLIKYISAHASVSISRVMIASGATGYSTKPKGALGSEIGRMQLASAADQNRVIIDLVPKNDEFEAVWALVTEQQIRKVTATLVCAKLKQDAPAPEGETSFMAVIISSSLRMLPTA
ncbi:MAG TPA: hypothetical protein VFR06_02040 [Gallionellaceae bacterium]|nr:hypothetical protein [Gallionellaceae bacterium]